MNERETVDRDLEPETIEVSATLDGERLDRVIATLPAVVSRSEARRLIELGRVSVAGVELRPSTTVRAGMQIHVRPLAPAVTDTVIPEDLPLAIVHEDEHLVVVDKPAGMVVHPGAGRRDGTLVAALLARYGALPGAHDRPGIVHRLDRQTSGLIVVARTAPAMVALQAAIQERRVVREYEALVWGVPEQRQGEIAARISRSRRDRRLMMASTSQGREALTHYSVSEEFSLSSRLGLRLGTGRTHQIRVHLRYIGYPVLGDPEYGGREQVLKRIPAHERGRAKVYLARLRRQALHAARLQFEHPLEQRTIDCTSPLPADMLACLELMRRDG